MALRVLRAGLQSGVRRVVLTSSTAAVRSSGETRSPEPLTEEDWTDPDSPHLTPYVRSKTIAERAAWDLVREDGNVGRLAVVNPSAILGPVLSGDLSYSLQVITRMLKGMPGVPRLGFSFVDVRDVADLQIRAMRAPEAAGERFLARARSAGSRRWPGSCAIISATRRKVPGARCQTRSSVSLRGSIRAAHGGR
jgi:dihydroflavonol-4-reductase